MSKNEGHFKVIRRTELKDLENGCASQIPESDLTVQSDGAIIQFEYVEPEDKRTLIKVKPGVCNIISTSAGVALEPLEMRKYDLLESIDNTSFIFDEVNKFFSRLDVYKQLKREPKRALLMASAPGVGKTAAINKVCEKLIDEDKGTAVLVWDTSSVKSQTVSNFFLSNAEFTKEVTRLILIIEDIGGGSVDGYSGGTRATESALLNLLDGVGTPFKGMPTFILATTNNPETSVAALIDRPGRFDRVKMLKTPGVKECEELLAFIAKKELTEEDKTAAKLAAKHQFSIAHLQECVVRSMLDDISILEVTEQLIEHKKHFKKQFQAATASIGLK